MVTIRQPHSRTTGDGTATTEPHQWCTGGSRGGSDRRRRFRDAFRSFLGAGRFGRQWFLKETRSPELLLCRQFGRARLGWRQMAFERWALLISTSPESAHPDESKTKKRAVGFILRKSDLRLAAVLVSQDLWGGISKGVSG